MPIVETNGVSVNFPFEPYSCQLTYMEKVLTCLKNSTNGVLESPTGTGKTLCLLCSSLAWLEDKKAQVASQRWRMAEQYDEESEARGALDHYKSELAQQLDEAAGPWSGELAPPKIIYASRTHSQLGQAVQELKRTAYRHFNVTVMGSREQLCINPQVMREESNSAKVHLCRAQVSQRSCHFYNNVESQRSHFQNKVLDIEDLVKLGKKNSCCPYYIAREMKNESDVIFMPYNYLLDPKSRKAHNIELKENIVIFDEAHNLEKMCEDSTSFDLSSTDIAMAVKELLELSDKIAEWIKAEELGGIDMSDENKSYDFNLQEVFELKAMLLHLEEKIDAIQLTRDKNITKPGTYMFELLSEVGLSFHSKQKFLDLLDKVVLHLTSEATSIFSSKGAGLSKFADAVKIVFSHDLPPDGTVTSHQSVLSKYYKVHIRVNEPNNFKKKNSGWGAPPASNKVGRTLSYWCFSPGHAMADLKAAGVRSIILTSGTLSPLSSFKMEMSISFPVELENPHVIEQHQVLVAAICKGPDGVTLNSTYNNRDRDDYKSTLGNSVVNFVRAVPQGLLIFFPSYPVMERCMEHWQKTQIWSRIEQHKHIYVEPRNKNEFATAMTNFYDKINDKKYNGAVFAAVCRGKVSEGLDFANNNGRAVVITGLPFPPRMDPRVTLKMQFLDEMKTSGQQCLSGSDWYKQQASRAVNQAVGRVIRHRHDYGAILLCDDRFGNISASSQLSSWVRPHVKVHQTFGKIVRELKEFFKTCENLAPQIATNQRCPPCQPAANIKSTKQLGAAAGFFAPVSSMKRHKPDMMMRSIKASMVDTHVPSQKVKAWESLGDQYTTSGGPSTLPDQPTTSQGLLHALDHTQKQQFVQQHPSISDTQIPSYQKQESLSQRTKKKIIIKGTETKTQASKTAVLSADNYVKEIKEHLSNDSYKQFTTMLRRYKQVHNFDEMVQCLTEIFTDTEANMRLIRSFYTFVKVAHRERFDKVCKELTGEGCGFKPEHAYDKKRGIQHISDFAVPVSMESTEQNENIDTTSTEKRRKLNSDITEIASALVTSRGTVAPCEPVEVSDTADSVDVIPVPPCGIPTICDNSTDTDDGDQNTQSKINCDRTSEITHQGITNDDTQMLMELQRGNIGYTCCICKRPALYPVKAKCEHTSCMECIKQVLKVKKECPVCNMPIKRSHLQRLLFHEAK